jgi:hypothetical protein
VRKVIISIVSITSLLLLPAAAQAWWGPGDECGKPNNDHCYSLTEITPSKPNRATILQVVDEGSDVADWNEGGFESQEEWILWPSKWGSSAWEEMGQIIGHGSDCCTPHPFQFERTPEGVDHEWFPQNVPNPGYADYMIYNLEGTTWDFFWGSPGGTNTKGQPSPVEAWYEEGYQWGGWPTRWEEAESGTEIGSESQPIDHGRDAVARWINESSPWYPWNGFRWGAENTFCRSTNAYLPAEGNQEWSVGCFK